MYVSDILKDKGSAVFTIKSVQTVKDAVDVLTERNIGALVVLDGDQRVSGILSERDVVRHVAISGAGVLTVAVHETMTQEVVTCRPTDTIDRLMQQMTERRIRHIPVVENDALLGLISIGDVVKRRIAETEQEAAALKEYIAANV